MVLDEVTPMISAPVALAFTAGMVATFNPCGFSLLPAYLGGFVAGDDIAVPAAHRLRRVARVSAAVSVGFVVVFGTVGLVIDRIASEARQQLPWVTIVIGALLVGFGVASVAGWRPRLPVPVPRLVAGGSGVAPMIAYGMTFAIASLSCTIGPFLAVTGAAIDSSAWEAGMVYGAYALGMGLVVLVLTLGAAFAHSSIAKSLRGLSRVIPRVGGALMVFAGSYAIWYGRWELAVYDGRLDRDPVVDRIEVIRLRLVGLVERVGPLQLVVLTAVIVVGVGVWPRVRRSVASSRPPRAAGLPSSAAESDPSMPQMVPGEHAEANRSS
ncbi:MAG: cytochrome C biogenesis protein [Acidimicrobiaceae bacterium]|nr:cytochrome C biogenesis protein [Acidimicrobiaceae bacterium]